MGILDDTIAAVSTPSGPSVAAIVRLSGPRAFGIVESLLAEPRGALAGLPAYSALDAPLRLRPDGPPVPATLYLMRAPRSYTRQDVAEVHTLGSVPLLRMLLDAFVERGARIAEPGEFTRRAFLAGRIDLAQAEAVLGLIQATTQAEHRAAVRAHQGHRSRHIHDLHGALVGLRARVEAAIDFAEHDIELISRAHLLAAIGDALAGVGRELRNADAGALPPEGIRVALCGLPNAGKSSLFNALAARERAIVTPVPGTTRDAIAEPLVLGGIHFRLYDTAGLAPDCGLRTADCGIPPGPPASPRNGLVGADSSAPSSHAAHGTRHASSHASGVTRDDPEAIDAEAVARARGVIAGTHIALVVVDASHPLTDAERGLWAEIRAPHKLLLLNKSDLPSPIADAEAAALLSSSLPPGHASRVTRHESPVLRISALTGVGLPELRAALTSIVRSGRVDASPADLVWNARHREALRKAREALTRAREAADGALGAEFVAADLRDAHVALGAITGQTVAEDILDVIFAEFCIGK